MVPGTSSTRRGGPPHSLRGEGFPSSCPIIPGAQQRSSSWLVPGSLDQRRNEIHAASTEDVLVTGLKEQKLVSRQREAPQNPFCDRLQAGDELGLPVTPYQQAIRAALSTKK